MLTRPASRPGSPARTDSISQTQAPHCRPSIARMSSWVPSAWVAMKRDRSRRSAGSGRECAQRRIEDRAARSSGQGRGSGWSRRPPHSRGSRSVGPAQWAGCSADRLMGLVLGQTSILSPSPRGRGFAGRVEKWKIFNARLPAASLQCRGLRTMPTASAPTVRTSAMRHSPHSARVSLRETPAPAAPAPRADARRMPRPTHHPAARRCDRSASPPVDRRASVTATTLHPSAASRCAAVQHRVVMVAQIEVVFAGLPGEGAAARHRSCRH